MTGRSLHDEPRLLFFLFQALGFIDEYGRYSTAVPLTLTFFFLDRQEALLFHLYKDGPNPHNTRDI